MIYLLLCIYAYVHGQTNAFLYSRKGAEALARNEHRDLVLERCIVGLLIVFGAVYGTMGLLLWVVTEIIAGAFAFSFWHNGAYYVMRARIDGKDLSDPFNHSDYWPYKSPTSTAKYDFTYKQRLALFLISLPVVIAGYIWTIYG